MTMQSVSLSALEASAANPRRKIDRKTIEGLAASIRTDGLLHNLVVTPLEGRGKKERYQIVSGSRRFEALRLLEQRGELPEDFTVAVEVRDDLSKDQTLRIATVENLQRQNMTPLEEAGALTKLVHKGVTLDDVVAQTGLSATTIKRRLALNALCKEAKSLLAKGGLTLSGTSAFHEITIRPFVECTGNNLVLAGDLVGRAIRCTLNAKCELPEFRKIERTGLLREVKKDRERYAVAALSIVQAFIHAGGPSQTLPLGSFEKWSAFVRDPLIWLGCADPCASMESIRLDSERPTPCDRILLDKSARPVSRVWHLAITCVGQSRHVSPGIDALIRFRLMGVSRLDV
jgi:ParB/RepB/Spo0J family partition protein